jgi:hypothetical protein
MDTIKSNRETVFRFRKSILLLNNLDYSNAKYFTVKFQGQVI